MNKNDLKLIIDKANKYKYSSFNEIDESKMKNSYLYLDDSTSLILMQNSSKSKIYWATNSLDNLVMGIAGISDDIKERAFLIGFVPVELSIKLKTIGFHITCEYIDYWLDDLSLIHKKRFANIKSIKMADYKGAYEIMVKGSNCSRGFIPLSIQELEEWNTDDNSHILAYYEKDKLIGLCVTRLYGFNSNKGTVIWIRLLAVDPIYHNHGIGSKLLQSTLMWGKENGAKRSFLAVDSENTAKYLYEKHGYKNPTNHGEINMEYNS